MTHNNVRVPKNGKSTTIHEKKTLRCWQNNNVSSYLIIKTICNFKENLSINLAIAPTRGETPSLNFRIVYMYKLVSLAILAKSDNIYFRYAMSKNKVN